MNNFYTSAIDLIAQNISVFPCKPDKKPYTLHGFKNATTDINQVSLWAKSYHDALVGVPTGKVNNLLVLDIDVKRDVNGFKTIKDNGWELPTTTVHATPTGGEHYLFEYVEGIKNSVGKLGPGLDMRSDGGYIIWYGDGERNPGMLAVAPQWLVNGLTTRVNGAEQTLNYGYFAEGTRNDTLFKKASKWRGEGQEYASILEALKVANSEMCRPPLAVADVVKIAKSVCEFKTELEKTVLDVSGKKPVRISHIIKALCGDSWLGKIRFDEFSQKKTINGLDINEDLVTDIRVVLEEQVFHKRLNERELMLAIGKVASLNKYHPVRDYFNGLTWDGTKRIDAFLAETTGCPLDNYHAEVSRLFFMTVMARVFEPGCVVRFCLMLIDPKQATGKSLLFQTLCPEKDWFSDDFTLSDMTSKVGGIKLHGRIIVEISELASGYRGKQTEEVKAFMTRTEDKFIPPYGRNTITYPRQTMLCGSTNNNTALVDPSGNTRFHPVTLLKKINLAKVLKNRDQLWAEAASRLKDGESYTVDPKLYDVCTVQQLAATQEDPWTERLTEAINEIDRKLTSTGIAKDILFIPGERQNNSVFARIETTMHRLGYSNTKCRTWSRKWHVHKNCKETESTTPP